MHWSNPIEENSEQVPPMSKPIWSNLKKSLGDFSHAYILQLEYGKPSPYPSNQTNLMAYQKCFGLVHRQINELTCFEFRILKTKTDF